MFLSLYQPVYIYYNMYKHTVCKYYNVCVYIYIMFNKVHTINIYIYVLLCVCIYICICLHTMYIYTYIVYVYSIHDVNLV